MVNFLIAVRRTHKADFKLRGGEVDAMFRHAPEEFGEPLGVGILTGGLIAIDHLSFLLEEVDAKHAAFLRGLNGDIILGGDAFQPIDERRSILRNRLKRAGLVDLLQRDQTGDHGEGVAGECPGLVHRPSRSHGLHNILLAAIRADWQATTDDLTHAGQVRHHACDLLSAAGGDAEAGHHFVEDEQRPGIAGDIAQPLQETVCGRDEAHIASVWLNDDRGNIATVLLKQRLDGVEVVILADKRVRGGALWHARTVRQAQRRDPPLPAWTSSKSAWPW